MVNNMKGGDNHMNMGNKNCYSLLMWGTAIAVLIAGLGI